MPAQAASLPAHICRAARERPGTSLARETYAMAARPPPIISSLAEECVDHLLAKKSSSSPTAAANVLTVRVEVAAATPPVALVAQEGLGRDLGHDGCLWWDERYG